MKILTLISGGDVGGAKTHVLSLLAALAGPRSLGRMARRASSATRASMASQAATPTRADSAATRSRS